MSKVIYSDETTLQIGTQIHAFERAGLGKAPFKFTGVSESKYQACPEAPIQPGTSCDYCGTAIMVVCHIKSADGKAFQVGSDCVAKTGDAGLRKVVDAKIARRRNDLRHDRENARIANAKLLLAQDAVRADLANQPHPRAPMGGFFGNLTRLDWAEWMMKNAGSKGRLEVAKFLGV